MSSTTDRLLRNAMREYARDPSDANAQKVAKLLQRAQGTPEGEGEKCPICKDTSPEREYWRDVAGVAKELISLLRPGEGESAPEISDREQLLDRLHEECDGAQRVIYTHQALECLLYSPNDDAMQAELGSIEGAVQGDTIDWSALAYWAFLADVLAHIEAEGINPNSPFPCSECSMEHDSYDEAQDCCSITHLLTTAMTVACGICQCVGAPREHDIDDCPGRTATTDILQVTCPQCQAIHDGESPDSVADQATSEWE